MAKISKMSTKEKILQTTEILFAENGYDGTKVDEIANKAGVNKALIYYYYNNKYGLLKELVIRHVQEAVEFKETLLEEVQEYTDDEVRMIFRKIFSFLEQKSEILSILTIETLKSGSKDKNIFYLLHPIYERTLSDLTERGYQIDDFTEQIIYMFFYGTIPATIFISLNDKWSEFYESDPQYTKELFQRQMEDFYVNFYREITGRKIGTY